MVGSLLVAGGASLVAPASLLGEPPRSGAVGGSAAGADWAEPHAERHQSERSADATKGSLAFMKESMVAGLRVRWAGGDDREGGGDGPLVILMHGFGAPGDDLVPLWRV